MGAYLIPLLFFVIPLITGVVAMRYGRGWIVPLVAGLLTALMVWSIWQGRQQAQGWDAIGYAILAMLMAAPGILGVLTGGAIGWWRRRRAARR